MKSKKQIDLDIPEGWTTYKLYTSFKYKDLNMEMFGDTNALSIYKRYVHKFFDLTNKLHTNENDFPSRTKEAS